MKSTTRRRKEKHIRGNYLAGKFVSLLMRVVPFFRTNNGRPDTEEQMDLKMGNGLLLFVIFHFHIAIVRFLFYLGNNETFCIMQFVLFARFYQKSRSLGWILANGIRFAVNYWNAYLWMGIFTPIVYSEILSTTS